MPMRRARTRWATWVIVRDQTNHAGDLVARLVSDQIAPYVLPADTLAALHAQLPPGMIHSERQPSDPPEVVATWVPAPP